MLLRRALLLALWAGMAAAEEPLPDFPALEPILAPALTHAFRADLGEAGGMPLYRIRASYDQASGILSGHLHLSFRNHSADVLTDLGFHTYPNARAFRGSQLLVDEVRVDGVLAWTLDPSVDGGAGLVVTLPHPIPPGQTCECDVLFRHVPSKSGGDHGLGARREGAEVLYGWYPELAARIDHAWQLHPLNELCDPCQLEMEHVEVELSVPVGTQVLAGGLVGAPRLAGGGAVVSIAAPFTRDLALVLAQDLEPQSRVVGETVVTSWCAPGDEHGSDLTLGVASRSLALFAERFGPYPFVRLTAVDAPLGDGVGGMESTGLVLLDRGNYVALREDAERESLPRFLQEVTVSHEVAHQWWYSMVGSDPWRFPYLDESLANWSCFYYLEQAASANEAAGGWASCQLGCSDERMLHAAADLDCGHYTEESYSGVIYDRGALMYQALRRALGDERFFAFLRSWCLDHRFKTVDERTWKAAILHALGPAAGVAFIQTWLEGHGLSVKEVAAAAQVIHPRATAP